MSISNELKWDLQKAEDTVKDVEDALEEANKKYRSVCDQIDNTCSDLIKKLDGHGLSYLNKVIEVSVYKCCSGITNGRELIKNEKFCQLLDADDPVVIFNEWLNEYHKKENEKLEKKKKEVEEQDKLINTIDGTLKVFRAVDYDEDDHAVSYYIAADTYNEAKEMYRRALEHAPDVDKYILPIKIEKKGVYDKYFDKIGE